MSNSQDFIYAGVLIELQARMSLALTQVLSPTHNINVIGGLPAGRARVTVVDENPLDRDVVITLTTDTTREPQIYIEQSQTYGTMAMMLSIVPNLPELTAATAIPQEFIFIVDRSGSMSDKVVQVRLALRQVLGFLPPFTLFNFIGYGNFYSPLFTESQSVDTHLTQGLSYADSMQADMGGTQVLGAIQYVLALPPKSDYQRRVFLFTDGEVSNTQEVIQYVAEHLGNARIFTLGIGAHASTELVNGVARAGRGSSEFVDGTTAEAVQSAVQRQIDMALLPALTNLQLDWGLSDAGHGQQSPYIFPLLAHGKRFLLYYISSLLTPPQAVTLSATIMGSTQIVEFTVPRSAMVILDNIRDDEDDEDADDDVGSSVTTRVFQWSSSGDMVHKMAGRSLIRDLEEGRSILHAQEKSRDEIRAEIVRLGLLYQLASSETSFLAVDDGETLATMENLEDETTASGDRGGGMLERRKSSILVAYLLVLLSSLYCVM